MTRLIDQEQELLWESVAILSKIDKDKANTVLKATIEKSFYQLNFESSILSNIRFSAPSFDFLSELRETEKKMRAAYEYKDYHTTYYYLAEYVEQLSELIEEDSTNIKKKLYASLFVQNQHKPYNKDNHEKLAKLVAVDIDKPFYKPSEVAEKLGLSDQTIRRMCDQGKFPGAYQTDGGHWRIPQDAFITTREQDERAKEVLHQIDIKNMEVGDVDEFDL
jgi:excisionase family DNA binding protein